MKYEGLARHCPVIGCRSYLKGREFICTLDGARIPKETHQLVWSHWREGHPDPEFHKYVAIAAQVALEARRAEERRAKEIPVPVICHVKQALTPDAPAAGVHYLYGDVVGFIPTPPWSGQGRCWWCGAVPFSAYPPLCVPCAKLCWNDDIFKPQALIARGIKMGIRAR